MRSPVRPGMTGTVGQCDDVYQSTIIVMIVNDED